MCRKLIWKYFHTMYQIQYLIVNLMCMYNPILIIHCKLENSKSEIRRLIKGNAIKIDNEIINDDKFMIRDILLNNNYFKLSIGKKKHFKIVS